MFKRIQVILKVAIVSGVICIGGAPMLSVAHAQNCASILNYGGKGDGTTDNVTAFNSAVAALPSGGGCIAFPAGRYYFSSAVTVTYPAGIYSLTIEGSGADNATLYFPASDGIIINAQSASQSIHVHGLTFSTGSAGGYTALALNRPGALARFGQSDIVGTTFRGDDGGEETDYWTTGINVTGLSSINFDTDLFYGNSTGTGSTGISLSGNPGTSNGYGVVYNISKSGFYSLENGLTVGAYIQGVTVTQSNFVHGTTCVLVPPNVAGLAELALTGGNNLNCDGSQVLIQSPVAAVIMNGNLIYIKNQNTAGVWFDGAGSNQISFVNNIFAGLGASAPTGATGIRVNFSGSGVAAYANVTGNVFYNVPTGVDLTNALDWNVQANSYTKVTTPVLNTGTYKAYNSVGIATE